MTLPDSKKILLEEGSVSDEQFEQRSVLSIVSVGIFLIGGPLFIYFGFYLLTSPISVKWGALSIAIGLLVMAFGFSLWQDRQIQTLRRLQKQETEEIRRMVQELAEGRH